MKKNHLKETEVNIRRNLKEYFWCERFIWINLSFQYKSLCSKEMSEWIEEINERCRKKTRIVKMEWYIKWWFKIRRWNGCRKERSRNSKMSKDRCVRMYVRVCVWGREREREREKERHREREKEGVCVCECVCVCWLGREWEKEKERQRERERGERERSVCVCVCVCVMKNFGKAKIPAVWNAP